MASEPQTTDSCTETPIRVKNTLPISILAPGPHTEPGQNSLFAGLEIMAVKSLLGPLAAGSSPEPGGESLTQSG